MIKVIVFGAATGGKKIASSLLGKEGGGRYEILFFVDNDAKKWNQAMSIGDCTYDIKPPQCICDAEFDKVVIASACGEDIFTQLTHQLRIPYTKIDDFYIRQLFTSLEIFLEHFAIFCEQNAIGGSLAELGVYQGDSAKRLNAYFPHKKLYLFDTFEGYATQDIQANDKEALGFGAGHLDNTSVSLVMDKMPYPHNVVIKKGWFPRTTQGLEQERFCLVNLDPDLYEPLKAGLEFFYPRLLRGGIILVSGYFSPHTGPKKACDEFCKQHNLSPIPLGFGNFVGIVKG